MEKDQIESCYNFISFLPPKSGPSCVKSLKKLSQTFLANSLIKVNKDICVRAENKFANSTRKLRF